MSSTGASYAYVYVQQKRQEDKLKKMEENKAENGDDGVTGKGIIDDSKNGKNKQIHPFLSPDLNPGSGGRKD
ncbi:hypothetical protein CDL12_24464 [Handroanthus impetiginosus]|uniref:Uncharacterized protein n=1 Tax=Handroanthus impetiginosus TaxID=429701 RepID=A0A2G9GCJ7_9LAMI|nr:hypothetical protein CDL12_24464 [Handroanthus impetiginosus]